MYQLRFHGESLISFEMRVRCIAPNNRFPSDGVPPPLNRNVQPAADVRLNGAAAEPGTGCGRLRRPNPRLEPMALWATAQPPPR